ncbi:methyltransferase domain-containing protein, partial [Candidatus Gottesmanbacteria bacterium]|nr:methyltransferase domain-containing protein [Candidatus Gottesmanbacteria bacterium]
MKKHTKPLYRCRFCAKPLTHTFVDLGMTPLANSYVKKENIQKPENFYPLHTYVCNHCFLVQLPEHAPAKEIFNQEYAYFSSYTLSWLEHAKQYTQMMQERFQFSKKVLVIEIASNDGYLLQYFKQVGIPVLGIEPTINTASVARKKGIKTITQFFGKDLAKKLKKKKIEAKLLIGNNVLAHVPNLNDFISGMKLLLAKDGIITMEFPHLLKLIANNQFDTIYHEHFSYFSFLAVQKIFAHHGITLFDVEEIPTHGGSLRIFAKHKDNK